MRGYGSWRAHRIRAIRVPAAPTQRCHRRVSEETAILGSVNSTPSALPFEVLRATSPSAAQMFAHDFQITTRLTLAVSPDELETS